MKTTVDFVFEGCFHGCPHCSDASCGPNYCYHPSFDNTHYPMIIGYSAKSSQIPAGEKCPVWCPVKEKE